MNLINNDTLSKTKEYIDITSINLLYTSKSNYNDFKDLFKLLIKNQIKFIKKCNFDKNIIDLFGGFNKFYLFPILKWKEEFLGGTGYIDNIYPNNLSSNIMIGIDCYTRPFITIRTKKKIIILGQLLYYFKDIVMIQKHGHILILIMQIGYVKEVIFCQKIKFNINY